MNDKKPMIPESLQKTFTTVDDYIDSLLIPADPALDHARKAAAAAGLPEIAVTASQGKLLHLLARSRNARNILEIGTLGAYSTIWMARALPADGHLITLEFSPKHAKVARANIAHAGLSDKVELREGPALETLPELAAEGIEPFDFLFIDADKQNNAGYFEWALKLSHPGSLILVDNVIRDGAVADLTTKDPMVKGVQRLNDLLSKEKRVCATTVQTVGSKGYDGFTLALVLA
ncbi:MAG TPA: O-methyltransferase [Acidobacteriaceae bacterium]|nr:O-methyltransferase [Acidobacteriaceae bacterium]